MKIFKWQKAAGNDRRRSFPQRICTVATISLMVSTVSAATVINFQVLRDFTPEDNIRFSVSPLLEASDGMLYGTTYGHWDDIDVGAVFKISKDGADFSIIHRFQHSEGDAPSGALIEAPDGALYGNNAFNGTAAGGSTFRVNKDGSGFAVLHQFRYGTDGAWPENGLLLASDGLLYGTTSTGGSNSSGTVFRMDLNGSNYLVLRYLSTSDGRFPTASLIEGTNGLLYGLGNAGGISDAGTIFRMEKDGSNFRVIRDFTGADGQPRDNLIEGPNGKLYGTSIQAVFSLDHDGSNYVVLQHFGGSPADGGGSDGALVPGLDGALYGTTAGGGISPSYGTVFRLNPDGSSFEVLIRFMHTNGPSLGSAPHAGLVRGSDGALYGTCSTGGKFNRGTVFRLAPERHDLAFPQRVGAVWRISGRGTPLRSYTVQYSTNLNAMVDWRNLTNVAADAQGTWRFDEPMNSTERFYRAVYP
jgi:uncharacterized repeat protein (TIGR03803 family)